MSIPDSLKQANQAIALSYQPEQTGAPRISASGEDELAQAIIELALAHQVPVYENAALTRWLGQPPRPASRYEYAPYLPGSVPHLPATVAAPGIDNNPPAREWR